MEATMSKAPVQSPQLIASLALELYGIELDHERSTALCAEQTRFASALATAAAALSFDTLPASHAAAIEQLAKRSNGDTDD
jgi:hypothetical protein